MSVYIGKDASNNNLFHMTSDERSITKLNGGVLNTSVIHSRTKALTLASHVEVYIGKLSEDANDSGGWIPYTYGATYQLSISDTAHVNSGRGYVTYIIENGIVLNSGSSSNSATIASISSTGVVRIVGKYSTNTYSIGILFFNENLNNMVPTNGSLSISRTNINVGSFNFDTASFVAINTTNTALPNCTNILTGDSGVSLSYPNRIGNYGIDLKTATLSVNGDIVLGTGYSRLCMLISTHTVSYTSIITYPNDTWTNIVSIPTTSSYALVLRYTDDATIPDNGYFLKHDLTQKIVNSTIVLSSPLIGNIYEDQFMRVSSSYLQIKRTLTKTIAGTNFSANVTYKIYLMR